MNKLYLNPDSKAMTEFFDGKIGVEFDIRNEAEFLMHALEDMGYKWAFSRMPRGCTRYHVIYMKDGLLRWSGVEATIKGLRLNRMPFKEFCWRAEEPPNIDSISQDALMSLLNM